jgi:hypothetical protein
MADKLNLESLEQMIQEEIWRIQFLDYPTPNTNVNLHKMQKELKLYTMDETKVLKNALAEYNSNNN